MLYNYFPSIFAFIFNFIIQNYQAKQQNKEQFKYGMDVMENSQQKAKTKYESHKTEASIAA